MDIPSVPDFYKPLSLRLCKVLDNIGASEDTQKRCIETVITCEIVCSFTDKKKRRYIFGSRVEGTTTFDLRSDIDYLILPDEREYPEIFQSISDIPPEHGRECRLMVRDGYTKPGYCKLQMVKFRTPITRSHTPNQLPEGFQFDCNDRVIQAEEKVDLQYTDTTYMYTAHGPAWSIPATSSAYGTDIVRAQRCRSWPNVASEWLNRERKFGWPSQDLIEKMKNLGFFVVSVGHPHSSERDLECRISLSLQERLLMFSLNPTQFKCYILLKMVKKDYINKKLRVEAISSYHCKTCLFYMIESTPGYLWQPKNLLACLQGCLKCIYRWVKIGNCPNYFIPAENMFEGRIDEELRINLEKICYVLLTADCSFLLSIQCDDVAKRMVNSIFPGTAKLDSGILPDQRLAHYMESCTFGSTISGCVLDEVSSSTTIEAIREIFRCIYNLSHAIPTTEYTSDQMRTAARIGLPYLEINLLSIIMANRVELDEAETVIDLLLSSKWQELSKRSDGFSAKLKQANFLYMVGQYEACQEVLIPIVSKRLSLQISYCCCKTQELRLSQSLFKNVIKGTSFDEFRTNHFASCINFSWLEKKVIPTALAYELLRSVHMQPASLGVPFKISDCAMVDRKIFLYFLKFLLSKAKGTQDTGTAIKKMERILHTDINLRHKETAMNLIGWCYKEERNILKAIEYFYLSLSVERNNNAAFWHILFTVCDMISSKHKQNANRI